MGFINPPATPVSREFTESGEVLWGASGSGPNIGGTGSNVVRWFRLGSLIVIDFYMRFNGPGFSAGSGTYQLQFDIPNPNGTGSLTIDFTDTIKWGSVGDLQPHFNYHDAGTCIFTGFVYRSQSASHILEPRFAFTNQSYLHVSDSAAWSATVPAVPATTDEVYGRAIGTVAEWA